MEDVIVHVDINDEANKRKNVKCRVFHSALTA